MSFWEKALKVGRVTASAIAKQAQKKQARSLEQMGMRLGGQEEQIQIVEAEKDKLRSKQSQKVDHKNNK